MTDLSQPPHDLAAEQAAVGSAIQSGETLAMVLDVVAPEDFYQPVHEAILRAALGLESSGQPVDPVTVAAELHRQGQLVRVGGAPYLHTCMASVPTTVNAGYYAEIVAEKATLRRLARAGMEITRLAYAAMDPDDVDAVVERGRAAVDAVSDGRRDDTGVWTAGDLVDRALVRYKADAPPSLSTGWADIDHALKGGLRPGTLTIVGARPKVGKSMLGVALPLHVANHGHPAAIVSLEMPEAELADRIIAQLAGVETDSLTKCQLSPTEWGNVEWAAAKFRQIPLRIIDNPRQTLATIKARVRDFQRHPGCELLVVDYLGLVTPADSKANRQEQVAAVSRGLKLLAKEMRIPVVALAQINRGPEQRSERRPLPSDLRESGAIEADADAVWLLHRAPDNPKEIEVHIAYNRHGPESLVHLRWAPQFARVTNLAHQREAS